MAEGLLAKRVHDLGLAVRVRSAGVIPGSKPASVASVEVLRLRGVDLSGHRSRQVDLTMLNEASLVLGMTREHVRHVVTVDPEVWPRTFTLKELVRRGTGAGPRALDEPLDSWLARAGAGRQLSELMGSSSIDDIDDPIGQPFDVYDRTGREVDNLLSRLVGLVWPTAL